MSMVIFSKIKIFSNYFNKKIKALIVKRLFILYVSDHYWIGARGYKLYKYHIESDRWSYFARLDEGIMSLFAQFFLTRRLFRAEIRNLYVFNDNTIFCISKKGIYKYNPNTHIFEKSFNVPRGTRPLSLCQSRNGSIFFGEYFSNYEKLPVHIYKSEDDGVNWNIAYTFDQGMINHIHGIFYDKFTDYLWVVTGDREDECIIGYTDDEFSTFNIVFRGGQEFRTCRLLFYENHIVYATDSQYIKNQIKCFDRETLEITVLQEIQGSCIYSVQSDAYSLLSTTVEPSKVNKDMKSYLWTSSDGIHWDCICGFEKDILSFKLFQFGSIRFPEYNVSNNFSKIVFSGRALKKVDGNSFVIDLKNI